MYESRPVGQSVPYCELVSAAGATPRACSVPRNQHVVGSPAGAATRPRGAQQPGPGPPQSPLGCGGGGRVVYPPIHIDQATIDSSRTIPPPPRRRSSSRACGRGGRRRASGGPQPPPQLRTPLDRLRHRPRGPAARQRRRPGRNCLFSTTVTVGPRWARRAARRSPAPLRTLLLMTSVSATQRRPRPGRRNSPPHSLEFTPRTDTPRSIVAHRTRDGPDGCRGLIGRRSSVGHGPAAAEKRGPRKPSAESIAYAAAIRGEREAKRHAATPTRGLGNPTCGS